MALRAAEEVDCAQVEELVLEAPLVLPQNGSVDVQVSVGAEDGSGCRPVSVHSRPGTSRETGWRRNAHGTLTGVAVGDAEAVELDDLHVEDSEQGERVRWRQAITKPLRLNLDFDVIRTGDTLTGHSRAGRLHRSAVTGHRT